MQSKTILQLLQKDIVLFLNYDLEYVDGVLSVTPVFDEPIVYSSWDTEEFEDVILEMRAKLGEHGDDYLLHIHTTGQLIEFNIVKKNNIV